MTRARVDDMSGVSQAALRDDVDAVRARLEALARDADSTPGPPVAHADTLRATSTAFGLSPFESGLLLLTAAVELDSEVAALCGRADARDEPDGVTFALASRVFATAHWSALLPTGPLRYWRLIEVEAKHGRPLVQARLRVVERVLHHLLGLVYLDDSLHGVLTACPTSDEAGAAHAPAATRIAQRLDARPDSAFVLSGSDACTRRDVVTAACAARGLRAFAIRADDVPADSGERERLARVWMREALLSPAMLLVEGQASAPVDALVERIGTALTVSTDGGFPGGGRPFLRVHLASPSASERRTWWRAALGDRTSDVDGRLDALSAQFALSPGQIAAAIDSAEDTSAVALWTASRLQVRPALDDLAQRIEPGATWDDLVLPAPQMALLREIATHVRQRLTVYETWGFGAAGRGLGVTALFAGVSGTGKTMASEVLAAELQLDLYRVDLSQVVSKYIGETEKNLRRVFDAAEGGGVILLFDEADALFGKRSEVNDSHDRYANIEVSYLLQRMEAYRGLAILTTNQRTALDHAFLRRLRFIVEFPFPDVVSRAAIWRGAFPAATPTDHLDVQKLARLNVSGGSIRNIALNAAFLAADAGRPVGMCDLLRAARTECAKLDRPVSDAEVGQWT